MSDFLQKMIEIIWKDKTSADYYIFTQVAAFMSMLAVTLAKEENQDIKLNGYMIGREEKGGCSILMICGDFISQRKLMNILQQPPEEYKDKYVACVPCEEPNPVQETAEDKAEEDEVKVLDET